LSCYFYWMKKISKFSFSILLMIIPIYLFGCWYLSGLLIQSNNSPIIYQNYFPNEKVQDWMLTAKDGQKVSAWFIKKDTSKVVVLLAGKGGNRLSMVEKAQIYLNKNYSVVLPDLRGTGNSKADFVTIGYNERLDLLAIIDTLQDLHYTKIAAHGHSLGAATIAYSFKEFSNYSFVVLESCYDNIDHAFEHRMKRIHLPLSLAFPIKKFAEMRLNIDSQELYPENYMAKINCPVLFFCGDMEWQNPISESKKLFDKCASTQKYFYIFKGAQHQDFLDYSPDEYQLKLNKVAE
jgi:esterase/lipase